MDFSQKKTTQKRLGGYHYYYIKYAIAISNPKKIMDRTMVVRCKINSRPLTFCFPNNCSAPPDIAPDKPLLLPGCNIITVINSTDVMTSKTVKTVLIVLPPKTVHFD